MLITSFFIYHLQILAPSPNVETITFCYLNSWSKIKQKIIISIFPNKFNYLAIKNKNLMGTC